MSDKHFVINIKNTLDQELWVTTDHIRVQDTSAVKAGLCGKFLVCKLGIGKTLHLDLGMRYDQPKNSD